MTRRADRQQSERASAYKLCSLALQYPDDELIAGRGELAAAAAKLPRGRSPRLRLVLRLVRAAPPLELAQHYVKTFDLHKRTALYLTFYSHGDRRERGLALLRLKQLYRAAGLPPEGPELPDYLPLMLEFAAAARARAGRPCAARAPSRARARPPLAARAAQPLRSTCSTPSASSSAGSRPAERLSLDRLLAQGPPQELVGLEPFAPPEVMPNARARR